MPREKAPRRKRMISNTKCSIDWENKREGMNTFVREKNNWCRSLIVKGTERRKITKVVLGWKGRIPEEGKYFTFTCMSFGS